MSGNQYEADPRQSLFLKNYLDPKSDTFSNAYQSAIKAGYAKEYAESITAKENDWLAENSGDDQMLKKAENNLKEFLNEKDDKRIKADITKFVAERLGKKKYSIKTEVEHSGNINISKLLDNLDDNRPEIIKSGLADKSSLQNKGQTEKINPVQIK